MLKRKGLSNLGMAEKEIKKCNNKIHTGAAGSAA